jgi:hypothetical protein
MPIPDLLAGVFGQLPEELRSQVTTVLDAPEAAPVVAELVNGFKRQADYSRAMDEARAERQKADALYQSNLTWYEANAAALEAARRGSPTPAPAPAPTPAPSDLLTRDEVNRIVTAELDRFGSDALGVVAATQDLSFRHYQEFGERLNLPELIAAAGAKRVPLTQAYEQQFADRYQAKAQKAADEARAKLIAETEARVRTELATHPYPVRPQGVDTLSGLTADATKLSEFSAAAAAAEYAALEAARGL